MKFEKDARVIDKLDSSKRGTFLSYYKQDIGIVEWDDGIISKEETRFLISGALEDEFENLYNKHSLEIKNKIEEIKRNIKELTEVSEKHGIPFEIDFCSTIDGYYIPESFIEKFESLDQRFIEEITNFFPTDGFNTPGWNKY